jgi:membrane protein YdbS with pleckstrin-like domain
MANTTLFNRNLVRFVIPVLLLVTLIIFVKSSCFQADSNAFTLGITLDLLITIPFIYFLLIRKSTIPKTTIVPMMILGLLIGIFVLPETNHQYLNFFKTWFLPIIELSVATVVIVKVRKAILFHKSQQNTSLDFFTTLKKTCTEILPKQIVVPFATEISVFYYGFIYWKRRKLAKNEFSYHKESGSVTLFFMLIMLISIEITPIHLLLAMWNPIVAWVLTILSIYSGFQIFGFVKSLMKRPIEVTKDTLLLRYGIMHEAEIPLNEIKEIKLSKKPFTKEENITQFALLGEMESHNILIEVHNEQILHGLFGIKKSFTKLALHVDTASYFKKYVDTALNLQKETLE